MALNQSLYIDFKNHAKKLRDFLIGLLFPVFCVSCKKEGYFLCPDCFNKINIKIKHCCHFCKKPALLGKTCKFCLNKYEVDGVLPICTYKDEATRNLIKKFKYYNIKNLDITIGKLVYIGLKINFENKNLTQVEQHIFDLLQSADIVPVPLHTYKLRFRGFNQAERIADKVAYYFKKEVEAKTLKRIKFTFPQAKKTIIKRLKNLKNSFKSEKIKNKNIILIDDVATSGITLNECAKELKRKGAAKVWAIVLADD